MVVTTVLPEFVEVARSTVGSTKGSTQPTAPYCKLGTISERLRLLDISTF